MQMYKVRYVRDGKQEEHETTRMAAMTLVDYLKRTFRISAEMHPVTTIGSHR